MIKCPYCNKIQTEIIEDEKLKSPILKCCKCNKSFVYQSYNFSQYNPYWLKIIEGIKMEEIPVLWGNDPKAMKLYKKFKEVI